MKASLSTIVKPRFRVHSFLVGMLCIALLVTLFRWIEQSRSPHWDPYTPESLQTALDRKQSVLITLSADWTWQTRTHEITAVNSVQAFRVIRNSGLITLRADATHADPDVIQLMKDHGLISVPAFLLYNPARREDPIILKDLVTEEQLLDAIRSDSERSRVNDLHAMDSVH
ncbi:hypothetical protein SH501x_001786 [Pirellulaceae bacterium SH501]